jgi:hypothetical protein
MKQNLSSLLFLTLTLLVSACQTKSRLPSPPLQVSKDLAFTEFFRRTNGWVAGDGAVSVPISDGRTFWLFGDSHIDCLDPKSKTVPCLFQSRNAGLLQKRDSFKDAETFIGTGPGFRSFFKMKPGNDPWFWPLLGFEENHSLYIYLTELRQKGTGTFGFENTGHDYFARMQLPELTIKEYIPVPHLDGRGFGLGFAKEKGGYIYTYGTKGTKAGTEVYVARFKATSPGMNWTFWDGHDWSTTLTNAASVFRTYAVSLTVQKVRNKYLLVGSGLSVKCDMGRELFMATADHPTGPFTSMKKIYTIDDSRDGHSPFFYLPMVHPEFINSKDELLVTYSINGYEPCVPMCVGGRMNPDEYRPRAIRVPLQLIDPGFK